MAQRTVAQRTMAHMYGELLWRTMAQRTMAHMYEIFCEVRSADSFEDDIPIHLHFEGV